MISRRLDTEAHAPVKVVVMVPVPIVCKYRYQIHVFESRVNKTMPVNPMPLSAAKQSLSSLSTLSSIVLIRILSSEEHRIVSRRGVPN